MRATGQPFDSWAIYAPSPSHPCLYVARQFIVEWGHVTATQGAMRHPDLNALRLHFRNRDYACLPRLSADAPTLVEVWLGSGAGAWDADATAC